MFHFIFDYNYGNFWQILTMFLPQETGINTLPNMYKLFHFNLTMSLLCLVKLKITQNSRQFINCSLHVKISHIEFEDNFFIKPMRM